MHQFGLLKFCFVIYIEILNVTIPLMIPSSSLMTK